MNKVLHTKFHQDAAIAVPPPFLTQYVHSTKSRIKDQTLQITPSWTKRLPLEICRCLLIVEKKLSKSFKVLQKTFQIKKEIINVGGKRHHGDRNKCYTALQFELIASGD